MKVIKRNGKTDDFQVVKVKKAIEKAFRATETSFSEDMLDIWDEKLAEYADKVYKYRTEFIKKIKDKINSHK